MLYPLALGGEKNKRKNIPRRKRPFFPFRFVRARARRKQTSRGVFVRIFPGALYSRLLLLLLFRPRPRCCSLRRTLHPIFPTRKFRVPLTTGLFGRRRTRTTPKTYTVCTICARGGGGKIKGRSSAHPSAAAGGRTEMAIWQRGRVRIDCSGGERAAHRHRVFARDLQTELTSKISFRPAAAPPAYRITAVVPA